MLKINAKNVEELVFYDKKLQKLLPEYANLFNQWTMCKKIPVLRSFGKKAVLDFLNSAQAAIPVLSVYFEQDVALDRLDYNIVKNFDFSVNSLEESLNSCEDTLNYFSICRNQDTVSITFWR